jgi:hypothetical protein
MKTRIVSACCWIFFLASSCNLWSQDSLFEQLKTPGLDLGKDVRVPLDSPLLMSSKPAEVKTLLDKLAQRHGWDRFAKNSPTAPVHIETNYVLDTSGKRVGHNIYSAFVAYSPLTTLKDEQLMTSLFGSSSEDKELMGFDPKELSADVLKKAGIDSASTENQRFSTMRVPLMNRVVIEGTARIERFEKEGCIVIAWQLEPRFSNDAIKNSLDIAAFANRYRKVVRNELGKEVESEPVSYLGCGGYLAVTQTGLEENQLLIESRMAMFEPDEWFAGSNFLRSKFPAVLQESAQSFRRKLSSKKP